MGMKLYLERHNYRYAVEQMLLVLFPEERPEYPGEKPAVGENYIRSTVSKGAVWTTAHTVLVRDGKRYSRFVRAKTETLTGRLETDRILQKIIKLSFFKAACDCTGETPPWGALTGIRPAKLVTRVLEAGDTEEAADRMLRDVYAVTPARRKLCIDAAKAGLALRRSLSPEEISLYVGIPFCPTRCVYCSFVSHSVEKSMKLVEPYLASLHEEIRHAGDVVRRAGKKIRSVYIGGGTPTTLSAKQLEKLMDEIAKTFDFSHCTEYTVEAGRPDTITKEKLEAILKGGATRISINPQTMRDTVLSAIGRRHTAADVPNVMRLARDTGFGDINMDLIAGLPEDDPEGFAYSVDRVLEMNPENITIHTLALKKGSRLALEGRDIPTAEAVGRMLDYAERRLREKGYVPYYLYRQKFMAGNFENVGWCLPGYEGVYNICIMEELHTILSLGAGGTTKLVNPSSGLINRVCNPKYPYEYVSRLAHVKEGKETLLTFCDGEETRRP
jgi:oxygen-independent coproporphyrinogen-3 oxidase